jgi:hypothetical protein
MVDYCGLWMVDYGGLWMVDYGGLWWIMVDNGRVNIFGLD